MRLLVTGGRDYDNRDCVRDVLDALNPDSVIHGGATGADSLASEWARKNGGDRDHGSPRVVRIRTRRRPEAQSEDD